MIRLVGPGGAGKTTVGAVLARRLGMGFIDLDERFATEFGNISAHLTTHDYGAYATQNVLVYLGAIRSSNDPVVIALSSGFMTYPDEIHPDYPSLRRLLACSPTTVVLLPSFDYETCVAETVRRQLGRPFSRSPDREEQVIRARFGIYWGLPAKKVETMQPVTAVVEALVAHLLPKSLETTRCFLLSIGQHES